MLGLRDTLVPPLFDFENIREPRRWGLESLCES
jgi:hypothetical protein